MNLELDFTYSEKKPEKFLWKKLNEFDRNKIIENLLKEEKYSPFEIEQLIKNLNMVYINSRAYLDSINYKIIISDETITNYNKKNYLSESNNNLMRSSYLFPITNDKKIYYGNNKKGIILTANQYQEELKQSSKIGNIFTIESIENVETLQQKITKYVIKNEELKKNKNYEKLLNDVITSGNKIGIIGWGLILTPEINNYSFYNMTPNYSDIYAWNFIKKIKLNKGVIELSNELENIYNLNENDIISVLLSNNITNIKKIENIQHLSENKYIINIQNENMITKLKENNEIIKKNKKIEEEMEKNFKENAINILSQIFNKPEKISINIIRRILYVELGTEDKDKKNYFLKILKKLTEKEIEKLFDEICKNRKNKYNIGCSKIPINKKMEIIETLIKKHDEYEKIYKNNQEIKENNIQRKIREKITGETNDIISWFIIQIYGEEYLEKIRIKSEENNKYYYENLEKTKQEKLDKYIEKYKENLEIIRKFQLEGGVYNLRIEYEQTLDYDKKYQILDKLLEKCEKKYNEKYQYLYIKNNLIELVCYHEVLMSQIFREFNEENKQVLQQKLETVFFGESVDDDSVDFISCKMCSRPILRPELKMHSFFGKDGKRNEGYTRNKYASVIDKKIISQIKELMEIANLIYMDRLAYNITENLVYTSIRDIINDYIEPDFQIENPEDISLGRRLNVIIITCFFAKIILEMINSEGNIYPRGSKEYFDENIKDNNKILEYLLDWSIKKYKKVKYPAFTVQQLNESKTRQNLLGIYNKLKTREKFGKKYIIKPNIKYSENAELEEKIQILMSKNKIENNIESDEIIKYILNKNLTEIQNSINEKQGIYETIDKIDIPEVFKTNNYFSILTENYKNINKRFFLENEIIENINKTEKILKPIRKRFPASRIIKLIERLTKENINKYEQIIENFKNKKDDNLDTIIEYYQNKCTDNSIHQFIFSEYDTSDIICKNCGLNIEELGNPSKEYLGVIKKIYKEQSKEYQTIITKKHSKIKIEMVDENIIKKILKENNEKKIEEIISQITNSLKSEKYEKFIKSEIMKKILKTKKYKELIENIEKLGFYENKFENDNRENKKDIYNRQQLEQYVKNIHEILINYNLLKNTKYIDILKEISNSEYLIQLFQDGIEIKYDLNFDFILLQKILDDIKINIEEKINIVRSILINIIYLILKNNNETVELFILYMIDEFFYYHESNDITELDFELQDKYFEFARYRKAAHFLNMTMEEKIEEGILTLNYEEQEEFFIDYMKKEFGILFGEGEKDTLEGEYERSQKSSFTDKYNDEGVNLEINYDYEPEEDDYEKHDLDE